MQTTACTKPLAEEAAPKQPTVPPRKEFDKNGGYKMDKKNINARETTCRKKKRLKNVETGKRVEKEGRRNAILKAGQTEKRGKRGRFQEFPGKLGVF